MLLVALAVVVGSAAFGLALDRGLRPDDEGPPPLSRGGSELVDETAAEDWAFERVPDSYRVVYSVETRVGDDVTYATQELVVVRPFQSRFVAKAGEPPGGRITASRVSDFGAMALTNSSGESGTFAPPPGVAGSDLRADIALPEAVDRGIVELREQRRVERRRCQVYRTGGPVNAGDVTPYRAGTAEYADVCVDRDGLVLEEVWFRDGDWVRRRIARTVDSGVDRTTSVDVPEETVSGGPERGYVRRVHPATLPDGRAYVLTEAPDGFSFEGRYVFSPPDLRAFAEPGTRGQATSIGVTDVYERGVDVVFVEQTISTTSNASFPEPPNSDEVDLGSLGTAETVLDMRGNQVRIALPESRGVRVFGTLPIEELVAIARQLVPVEGTGVVILDE